MYKFLSSVKTEKLKSFYLEEQDFSSYLLIHLMNMINFHKINFVSPRIKPIHSKSDLPAPKQIFKVPSDISFSDPVIGDSSLQTIDLNSLFTEEKAHILLEGEKNDDHSLWMQHVVHQWSLGNLWQDFAYVFRVDLGRLAIEDWERKYQSIYSNKETNYLNILLHTSLNNICSIEELKNILNNKNNKILLILKGFEKIEHLLHNPNYNYINNILDLAKQQRYLVVTTEKSIHKQRSIFNNFDKILINEGYLPLEIKKYLQNNFSDNKNYNELLNFVFSSHEILRLCKSPSLLQMVSYLFLEKQGLKSAPLTTSTALYYDLIYLLGSEFKNLQNSTPRFSSSDLFNEPIIQFMQEIAFHSLFSDGIIKNHLLAEIEQRYIQILKNEHPIDLAIDFRLVTYHKSSTAIEPQFVFVEKSFHAFFAARYIKKTLSNKSSANFYEVGDLISKLSEKEENTELLKFLIGIITLRTEGLEKSFLFNFVFEQVMSNSLDSLYIHGNKKITLLMHMLSQAINQNGIDSLVPSKYIEYIDKTILQNLLTWQKELKETQYYSTFLIQEIFQKLESNDKNKILEALSIIPSLTIRSDKDISLLLDIQIKFTKHQNQEIAEKAINSMRSSINPSLTKSFIVSIINEHINHVISPSSINILLSAMDILTETGGEDVIELFIRLLQDQDARIIYAALTNLKQLVNFSQSKDKIIDVAFKLLAYQGGSKDLIITSSLNLLHSLNYNAEQIVIRLITLVQSVQVQEIELSLVISKNINKKITEDQINLDELINAVLTSITKTKGAQFPFLGSKDYSSRIKLIELCGVVYPNVSEQQKLSIETLLKNQIKHSGNQEVISEALLTYTKIKAINSQSLTLKELDELLKNHSNKFDLSIPTRASSPLLAEQSPRSATAKIQKLLSLAIFNNEIKQVTWSVQFLINIYANHHSNEAFQALRTIFKDTKHDQIKISILAFASSYKDKITETHKIEIIDLITENNINHNKEVKLAMINAYEAFQNSLNNLSIKAALERYVLDSNSHVRNLAIETYIKIYRHNEQFYTRAVNHFLKLLRSDLVNAENKLALIKILSILAIKEPSLSNIVSNAILDQSQLFLENLYKNKIILSLSKLINFVNDETIYRIGVSLDIAELNDTESIKNKIRHLTVQALLETIPHKERFVDELSRKYINYNSNIPYEDIVQIKHLYGTILFLALQSENNLYILYLKSLLEKVPADIEMVANILDYKLSNANSNYLKQTIIEKFKRIFKSNQVIENLISKTEENLLLEEKNYDTVESIFNNLESFKSWVDENLIDIKINSDFIEFNDQQIALGSNIESRVNNAEILYNSLKDNAYTITKDLSQQQNSKIFPDLKLGMCRGAGFDISLFMVHTTSGDKSSAIDFFVLTERRTIFGYSLIKKISVAQDNTLKNEHFISTEPYYKQLIFGGPNEDKRYSIKELKISLFEEQKLLTQISHCKDRLCFINIIKQNLGHKDNDLANYDWKKNPSFEHNNIIGYNGLETRINALELSFMNLEQQIKSLALEQQTIQIIIKTLKHKFGNIGHPFGMNDYQKALYITIVHEIMELYMAAMVTSTEMVKNSKVGAIGKIGSLLQAISAHVPIIGSAVNVFGYILVAVDASQQQAIITKIASLALDCSSVGELAKKIAETISTHNLKESALEPRNFFEKAKISFEKNIQDKILEQFLGTIHLTEKQRGELDGKKIMIRLLDFIITSDIETEIDWQINSNKIEAWATNNILATKLSLRPSSNDEDSIPTSTSPNKILKACDTFALQVIDKVSKLIDSPYNFDQDSLKQDLTTILQVEQPQISTIIPYFFARSANRQHKNSFQATLAYQICAIITSGAELNIDSLNNAFAKTERFFKNNELYGDTSLIGRITSIDKFDLSGLTPSKFNRQVSLSSKSSQGRDEENLLGFLFEDGPQSINTHSSYNGAAAMLAIANSHISLNYLSTYYIPILPVLRSFESSKWITEHVHKIFTVMHLISGLSIAYDSGNFLKPIISSTVYYTSPYVHDLRDKLINYIGVDSYSVKLPIYVSTDLLITSALMLPFVPPTTYGIGFVALQGITAGLSNYFASQMYNTKIGNAIAFTPTTAYLYYHCNNFIASQPSVEMSVVATSICLSNAANIHYVSSFAGECLYQAIGNIEA